MDNTSNNNNNIDVSDVSLLVDSIQNSINELKENPQPTFQQAFKYRFPLISAVLCFSLIVFASASAVKSNVILMLALVALFWVAIFFAKKFYKKQQSSPIELADNALYTAEHNQEMYNRLINTIYQNNTELYNLRIQYSNLIRQQKEQRKINHSQMILIPVVGFIIVIAGYLFFHKAIQNNNSSIKEVSTISKMLKPYPDENAIATDYADCLSATDEAELTFDIRPFDLKQFNPNLYYQLRINKVKLSSTGNNGCGTPEDIRIFLYDKDLNPIKSLNPYIYERLYDYHSFKDEYKSFRQKGSCFYTDFVSQDSTNSEQIVKSIADSAFYYKLILL